MVTRMNILHWNHEVGAQRIVSFQGVDFTVVADTFIVAGYCCRGCDEESPVEDGVHRLGLNRVHQSRHVIDIKTVGWQGDNDRSVIVISGLDDCNRGRLAVGGKAKTDRRLLVVNGKVRRGKPENGICLRHAGAAEKEYSYQQQTFHFSVWIAS